MCRFSASGAKPSVCASPATAAVTEESARLTETGKGDFMEHERILHIYNYLCRNTDEEHGATCRDIQDYLSKTANLRNVSPLTIRRDIDRLCEAGNDIRRVNDPHNTAVYSLIDKGFTSNEIRFMVDSVSINKFLSTEQKKKLIHKFEGMCTDAEIRSLVSRITLNSTASPSLDLLENLDTIHRLISERMKINFKYGKFDTKKQMNYYSKSREMIPRPRCVFRRAFLPALLQRAG